MLNPQKWRVTIQFGLPTKEVHCVATITQSLEYVLKIAAATVGALKAVTTGKVAFARKNFVIATANCRTIYSTCTLFQNIIG